MPFCVTKPCPGDHDGLQCAEPKRKHVRLTFALWQPGSFGAPNLVLGIQVRLDYAAKVLLQDGNTFKKWMTDFSTTDTTGEDGTVSGYNFAGELYLKPVNHKLQYTPTLFMSQNV